MQALSSNKYHFSIARNYRDVSTILGAIDYRHATYFPENNSGLILDKRQDVDAVQLLPAVQVRQFD